jgi:hypothetical protein
LVGNEPTLWRSTRKTTATTVPNIATTTGASYGAQMNQYTADFDSNSKTINYEPHEAKV